MSEEQFKRYQEKLLSRGRRFDPYRKEITEIFELNDPALITASSVFDLLEERYGRLPAGERSLRNYLAYLDAEGLIRSEPTGRTYLPVGQLPPGQQLQVDFGQYKIATGKTASLFCAILSHSRYRYVAVQDHPFTTREVIDHLLDCFHYIGGRPEELVIDQDRLMVASENAGDIITTRDFGVFVSEQALSLYVCRKADPQSKGKIENLVKFVKTSFFSARTFQEVAEISPKLAQWLTRRANGRVCQATKQIPAVVHEGEREHLRPLKPSIFLATRPLERDRREAGANGFISVAGSLYSVPLEYRQKTVEIYLCENELLIFDDESHKEITHHDRALVAGQKVIRKSHFTRRPSRSTAALEEEVARYSSSPEWSRFLTENRSRFSRYRREQASALSLLLTDQAPCEKVFGKSLSLCLENATVSAANLAEALAYFREIEHRDAPDVLAIIEPHRQRMRNAEIPVARRTPGYYSSLISILGAVA